MSRAILRTENWSNPLFLETVLDVVYELGWALNCHVPLYNAACKYSIDDILAIYTRCTPHYIFAHELKIYSASTFQYEMT